MATYRAIRINKNAAGEFSSELETLPLSGLPAGELLIRVQYSSLNYKDALSASGNPGVTRNFPHTPGIDAAGVVESSDSEDFQAGQAVLVTGYDLGMNTAGGLAEFICIPAAWAVPLPAGMSTREAMIIGTAGLTAALCVDKLQHMGLPVGGKVLVSGASGGVGSFAVALLSQLGYLPVASTGSADAAAFLQTLGADQILDRSVLAEANPRPMGRGEWDGAVDTVGGETLANIIKGLNYGASVAAVGLVGGTGIPLSVLPFILRTVNLLGIDSVEISQRRRLDIWGRLATSWKLEKIDSLTTEVGLEAVPELLNDLLLGQVRGRTLVKL